MLRIALFIKAQNLAVIETEHENVKNYFLSPGLRHMILLSKIKAYTTLKQPDHRDSFADP